MQNLRDKKLFIFDMDNCLYQDMGKRLETECFYQTFYDFVKEHYGYAEDKIVEMDREIMAEYGHYLKGWTTKFTDFPLDKLFEKFKQRYTLESVAFSEMLPLWISKLPGKKVVYTNAHAWHAEKALAHMGILNAFDAVYSVNETELANNHYKPHPTGFERIMKDFDVTPEQTVMFEDSKTNLKAAHALGIATVLVNGAKEDAGLEHVHHNYETINHFFEEFYKA